MKKKVQTQKKIYYTRLKNYNRPQLTLKFI